MTTSANPTQTSGQTGLKFEPYIFFYGRCEEALEFYKNALGGSYDMQRNEDTPMGKDVPEAWRSKVMHASFTAPGVSFMASDGRDEKKIDPDEGNISLSLGISDAAEGDRLFKKLSDGGDVKMPLDAAFWGGRFGMFVDRFGIEWMMVTD